MIPGDANLIRSAANSFMLLPNTSVIDLSKSSIITPFIVVNFLPSRGASENDKVAGTNTVVCARRRVNRVGTVRNNLKKTMSCVFENCYSGI